MKRIIAGILTLLAVSCFAADDYKNDLFDFGDAVDELIRVRYTGKYSIHNISMDNNGGGSSEAEVTVVIGTTTTTIDCNDTDYDTLVEVIAAINDCEDDDGVAGTLEAKRAHGAADLDMGNDNFIDATVYASSDWKPFCYRDVSEYTTVYSHRVRFPVDEQGLDVGGDNALTIRMISGIVDIAAGVSDVYLIQDDSTAASGETILDVKTGVADATWTKIFDYSTAPMTVKGPLMIEIVTTNDVADVTINTQYKL